MPNSEFRRPLTGRLTILTLALAGVLAAAAPSAEAAATIVIQNNDAAGVGFNDTTPVAPVGGNSGTTLGQQRLIAFQAAANTWGATLNSGVTITIKSQWTALTCTATTAVLGSAGAIQIWKDFSNAPFAATWYNESLTGKLTGVDPDPVTAEINANFNVNLGNAGCLTGTPFYLGLDNNHGSAIDLVTVLTHEFGHGLGFQTFTSGSTGAPNSGFMSAYDHFLMDLGTGKSWLQMSNAERVSSALNTHKLAWNGPQVLGDVPNVLNFGIPVLKVTTPAAIAGTYDVGTAAFGPLLTGGGITGSMLLANDGVGTTSDGCEAFPAGFFANKIAVIDRGSCSFKTKTLNAQNANALAVIIVNNAAGSPAPGLGDDATITTTITIPTVSMTQPEGQALEAQLGTGVSGTVQLDLNVRAGADPFGKALMFSPNPFQSGSSVSHWDTIAFPNQLMEPAINGDLTHNVTAPNDLTFSEMRDVGWVAQTLPSTILKTSGDNQSTTVNTAFALPLTVTTTPAAAGLSVTWTVNPASGAGATFPSTSSRFAVTTTNASGVATAPALNANGTAGAYAMNATVPGAGTATFSLTNVAGASADLAITKTDGVTTATPGSSVTYTITASNAGPSVAIGATVADTFPASLTCTWTCVGAGGGTCTASGSGNINNTVNLPNGASVTYTASCTISAAATGTLSNTATVAAPAGVIDPTPANNSATDSDTLTPSANLAITKTDGVTVVAPGGSLTYTIAASNAGPSNVTGANVVDSFPASETCSWTCVGAGGGSCTGSGSGNINDTVNLPALGSVTYTASCTVSVGASGTISNTATVSSAVNDPTPGNNSATDVDQVQALVDLIFSDGFE